MQWFNLRTRVELCSDSWNEQLLEEPTYFDDFEKADYNRLARDDSQIEFAPVINFVVLFTQYNSVQHK
jgi:hypothetical protein